MIIPSGLKGSHGIPKIALGWPHAPSCFTMYVLLLWSHTNCISDWAFKLISSITPNHLEAFLSLFSSILLETPITGTVPQEGSHSLFLNIIVLFTKTLFLLFKNYIPFHCWWYYCGNWAVFQCSVKYECIFAYVFFLCSVNVNVFMTNTACKEEKQKQRYSPILLGIY